MPTVEPLFKNDKPHFHTNGGELAVGYGIYTYYAGTNTPVAMYSDTSGSTVYSNPILLNSRGEPDGQGIYADVTHTYKVVLKDPDGSVVWSMDDVTPDVGVGVNMPKQIFLYNRGADSASLLELKNSSVQKLKLVSSGASVSKSDNFVIDEDSNAVTGLDPDKRYLVNISFMYDTNDSSSPHHIYVNGSQWSLINFYNEFTLDNGGVAPEWKSMSWVMTGKDSISVWASCSDATLSSFVEIWLRDLQIAEI